MNCVYVHSVFFSLSTFYMQYVAATCVHVHVDDVILPFIVVWIFNTSSINILAHVT